MNKVEEAMNEVEDAMNKVDDAMDDFRDHARPDTKVTCGKHMGSMKRGLQCSRYANRVLTCGKLNFSMSAAITDRRRACSP